MTSSSSPRVGVLGCGGRIRGIANRLKKLDPSVRITALCDPDDGALGLWKELREPDATVHPDAGSLATDANVDWVMIGSPNDLHRAHATTVLAAGKHVFCEKPLATTVDDALAIREAVGKASGTFLFGLVLRYSPFYRKVRALLDDGAVGPLISFEFNETIPPYHGAFIMGGWRRFEARSGGHLLEKCCHDLDIANWLCGSLPVQVASFGGNDIFTPANAGLRDGIGTLPDGRSAYEMWPDVHGVDPFTADKDTVDNQVAILQYANGVRASFHTNGHAAIPERRIYLLGTKGALRGDLLTGEITLRPYAHDAMTTTWRFATANGHGDGDPVQVAHLRAVMAGNAKPDAGVEEGVRSTLTALAIEAARKEGRVVDLRSSWQRAGITP